MMETRNGTHCVAIIQARMGSTRLPGKVLMPVMGKPLLGHMLDRLRPTQLVDDLVVATSTDSRDDAIVRYCQEAHVSVVRGSLDDVLGRYYQTAHAMAISSDAIVRLTADCPLHHYAVVDFCVGQFQQRGVDYFTNSFSPDFEDGFDVEIFSFEALEDAHHHATQPHEREHVTPYLKESPRFHRAFAKYREGYRYKLSVDSADDFRIVAAIIETLFPRDPLFTMDHVMQLLQDRPELYARTCEGEAAR